MFRFSFPRCGATRKRSDDRFRFLAQGDPVTSRTHAPLSLVRRPLAEATARSWAATGARLILVGRKVARLDAITKDLEARGADYAKTWSLDCATAESVAQLSTMEETLGGLDVLLLAYGALGDQGELQNDQNATAKLIRTNFVSAAAWCLTARAILEKQRTGALLGIGPVAGDRGRRSKFYLWRHERGLARIVDGTMQSPSPASPA